MSDPYDETEIARQCRLHNCTLVSIDDSVAIVELGRPALMNDGCDDEGALRVVLKSAGFEVVYTPYEPQTGDPESG